MIVFAIALLLIGGACIAGWAEMLIFGMLHASSTAIPAISYGKSVAIAVIVIAASAVVFILSKIVEEL